MQRVTTIVKGVIFTLIFSVMFLYANEVVRLKQLVLPWNMTTKITGLRYEPRDTMDVMYFGSSHMYCSINPVEMWDTYGIRSYQFATQQQPLWITYHYIKEALKYQKPKVIVLDILMTKQQTDYSEEGVNRTAIDLLPQSYNRLAMIQAAVPQGERGSYIINFIKYHSRWQELKAEDWAWANSKFFGVPSGDPHWDPRATDPLKGYVALDKVTPMPEMIDLTSVTDEAPLTDKVSDYLQRIIDLANEEGIALVFYKAPSNATPEEKAYFNTVEAIASAAGIPFIDYNVHYDTIGLDVATDFYDKGHVNTVGASKVTKHFGAYLQTHFNLPDGRTGTAQDQ